MGRIGRCVGKCVWHRESREGLQRCNVVSDACAKQKERLLSATFQRPSATTLVHPSDSTTHELHQDKREPSAHINIQGDDEGVVPHGSSTSALAPFKREAPGNQEKHRSPLPPI